MSIETNKDIQFYQDRLANLTKAREFVGTQDYFLKYWGEIPILKVHNQKGLRFGMDHAILGSMRMLKALGETDGDRGI